MAGCAQAVANLTPLTSLSMSWVQKSRYAHLIAK